MYIYTYAQKKYSYTLMCIYLRVLLDFRVLFFNDLGNTIGQKIK